MPSRQKKKTQMSSHGTPLQEGEFREAGARPRVNMLKQRKATNKRGVYTGFRSVRQDQRSV